eukprot:388453-Pelagomonas_calceolata.AAC.6
MGSLTFESSAFKPGHWDFGSLVTAVSQTTCRTRLGDGCTAAAAAAAAAAHPPFPGPLVFQGPSRARAQSTHARSQTAVWGGPGAEAA